MPKFGFKSEERLRTCHPDLQLLFNTVVRNFDCSIICGHRDAKEQTEAWRAKKSKLQWPLSKHNKTPSMAVDVAPYYSDIKNIDWKDVGGFYLFAGYVKRVSEELGIKVRFGGDWDSDNQTSDQDFNDLVHFELVED